MKPKILISSALAALVIACGIAVAAPMGGGPMRADANGDGKLTRAELTASLDKRFAELDKNGDGKVTKEEREAGREARFEEHFKAIDKDNNGQISRDEMKAAHEARMGDGHRGMRHHGKRHGGHGGPGGRMAMIDADKDGVVTKAEFQGRALEMFAKADTDKDGVVTQAEREAARAAMKKMMRDKAPPLN